MFIYVISNDVNQKAYVGLHFGRDLRTRWGTHRSLSKHGSRSLISLAIRKHGIEKFHITSLWSGHISHGSLKSLERYFIRSLDTKSPNGYNMTDGGDGTAGFRHTNEERQRRRERMLHQIEVGNIKLLKKGEKRPAEIGHRISAVKTGKKRKPFTAKWRANMSAALRGNTRMVGSHPSPITIAKRVASRAGYRHSEETKMKISAANKLVKHAAHSEETRKKMSESQLQRHKKMRELTGAGHQQQ